MFRNIVHTIINRQALKSSPSDVTQLILAIVRPDTKTYDHSIDNSEIQCACILGRLSHIAFNYYHTVVQEQKTALLLNNGGAEVELG